MISQLEGTIAYKDISYLILNVGGVGYKVHMLIGDAKNVGEKLRVWTHLSVREDALDLYGFMEREELEFLEDLIKISGIGPKTALSILSLAPMRSIQEAVSRGDSGYLTKFAGVGKKTAEKIILELSDKMPKTVGGNWQEESDALEALVSLGYGKKESSEALKDSSGGTGERVKFALRKLGKEN